MRSWGDQLSSGRFGDKVHGSVTLYDQPGDDEGVLRMKNALTKVPLSRVPTQPSVPVDAHVNIFTFASAYDVNTTNMWDETNVGSGTSLTVQDLAGGKAKVTNGTTDNNYYFYQSKYEVGGLASGKGLWLMGAIEIADVDQADWFWGLCKRLATGTLFDNRVDGVGFYGSDGSANINCETRKNSTNTAATNKGTLVDATRKRLGLYIDGTSRVFFYIGDAAENLAYVAQIATNLPDDELLTVSFGIRNGQDAANTLILSQVDLVQDI